MALSLNAEQKSILKVFKIEEQYVIPPYQRPYSWEYEHCLQLYNDLMSAFVDKEDYFIGNIIIAKDLSDDSHLELVDGQQRMLTMLLMLKVLSLFFPELSVFQDILTKKDIMEDETIDSPKIFRIRSDIFEKNDNDEIKRVLKSTKEDFEKKLQQTSIRYFQLINSGRYSKIEMTSLHFYYWFLSYNENNKDLKEFVNFLLKQVFLLPIELSGNTYEEANGKALTIFETINNRGMNLVDADIFKAKLFNKAKKIDESELFIQKWGEFTSQCEDLQLGVDDIFRYYSHIIRGRENLVSSEIKLRDFFTNKSYSPIEVMEYSDVINDLFKILAIMNSFNIIVAENREISKWLQLIEEYTNLYPKYALVCYKFFNEDKNEIHFVKFLKSLIRYVYYRGSTTTIKFEIYQIIKHLANGTPFDTYYQKDITPDYFNYLGRLKKGYSLLAYYIDNESMLNGYRIVKLINPSDCNQLKKENSQWETVDFNDITDSLGNYVVLNIKSPYNKLDDRLESINCLALTPDYLNERNEILKNKLVDFFRE